MSHDKKNVAIVGATGLVGEALLSILAEKNFPIESLKLVASERSAGARCEFKGKRIMVEDLQQFDFKGIDIAIFSAGKAISLEYAPKAAACGCVVIDNSSAFRNDDDVPLIVPEVNGDLLKQPLKKNIIANPNCSTIQLVMALKPIFDEAGIARINVSTYQAVSGQGRQALESLAKQTGNLLNARPVEHGPFPKQMAFNVIPQIDEFEKNGYTREEMKMVWETQKIFADSELQVNPTAVRVPVFFGHSMAVHVETRKIVTLARVKTLLNAFSGVTLRDKREAGGYATPIPDASGSDEVFVSRLRKDISHPQGINLWVVADNIRKGAALNAVQIAQLL